MVKDDYLLSIIVPCYNNDWCIDECINRIKGVTYDNWECIIINDGSSDNSENVIKENIKDDNRFRLYTIENGGVANARNFGLSLAKGEYCMFLDSDDLLNPKYPSYAMEYMREHSECPLYFGGVKSSGILNGILFPEWISYGNMLKEPCIFVSAVFKKQRALEIGGVNSELDAFEDYEFWIRYLYHNSENIKRVPRVMYEYRTRPNSRHFSKSDGELKTILEKIKELNRDIYEEYEQSN